MSGDDELDNTIDNLIEQYLLFLRGRGREPDLSVLPPVRRAAVTEQLKIVAALVGRDTELPPIEDDPVAIRLGLADEAGAGRAGPTRPAALEDHSAGDEDPVMMSLRDLEFRFHQQVTLDRAPSWASRTPVGMHPVAECSAPGETVAVLVGDVARWADEPDPVAHFFRLHDRITAIALVSPDAEEAVVVTAADAQHSIDPVRGWLPPHSPASPEPLGIALGRYLEGCLPAWERVADLDELLDLGDLDLAVAEISAAQLAAALRAKPRLAHKKESQRALSALDPQAIAAVVVDVRSGLIADDELLDRATRLAEVAGP